MRKNKIRIVSILLITLSIISIGANSYAHSGRTDSSGGHRDNKNRSGLGSYHYHCGGHPAHLHTNGVCPYSARSSSSKSSSSPSKKRSTTSSSSSSKTTATVPSNIAVTSIQINENIENIEVGKSKILTATVTPNNATNKSITWKSDDESIATINSKGEFIAKKSGTVNITATSSNGKTSTTKINVKEESKNNNEIMTTITNRNSTINNNTTTSNQEEENILGGVAALGLLGGAGYWTYKRYKK